MAGIIFRLFLFPLLLVNISLFFVSCKKKTDADTAVVVFIAGTAEARKENMPPRQLDIQDNVGRGETLTTGELSSLNMQISDNLIKITEKTTIVFEQLTSAYKSEIALNNGTILSRVKKGKSERSLYIKTPVAVMAVRGTEFSITHSDDSGTTITVKEGQVSVSRITERAEEVLVDANQTAVVKESISKRDASEIEILNIKKVSVFPELQTSQISEMQRSEIEKMNVEQKKAEEEIDAGIKKILDSAARLTLDQIRAKYGRIDRVTLFNGTVYTGAIVKRGDFLTMETPAGMIKIEFKKVKNTGIVVR